MTSGENQELKIKKSKYILFLRFIIEFSRIIIIIITIIIIIVVVVVVVVIAIVVVAVAIAIVENLIIHILLRLPGH